MRLIRVHAIHDGPVLINPDEISDVKQYTSRSSVVYLHNGRSYSFNKSLMETYKMLVKAGA
jgi:hypothetical protein